MAQGRTYIRWSEDWRNLANTTEPSMCGGDAAFLSNFDNLFTSIRITGSIKKEIRKNLN